MAWASRGKLLLVKIEETEILSIIATTALPFIVYAILFDREYP